MEKNAVHKRLIDYSALVLGLLSTSNNADAQVLYFDFSPDSLVYPEIDTMYGGFEFRKYSYITLDLLRDGEADLGLRFSSGWSSGPWGGISVMYGSDKAIPIDYNLEIAHRNPSPWVNDADVFFSGDTIGPSLIWKHNGGRMWGEFEFYSYGYWPTLTPNYLGLRYEIEPGSHIYGWLKMQLSVPGEDCGATLYEFIWNYYPNVPIIAGMSPPAGSCAKPVALSSVVSPGLTTLSWLPDTAVEKTHIQGRASATSSFGNVYSINNTRAFSSFLPGTSYEWRARSICENGLVSDFSALTTFSLPLLSADEEETKLDGQQNEIKIQQSATGIQVASQKAIEYYAIYNLQGSLLVSSNPFSTHVEICEDLPIGIYILHTLCAGDEERFSKFSVHKISNQ